MRMRKKKNGDQRREACADYFIQEKPYDKSGTMRWLDWSLDNYQKYGFGLWAIELKENGEFVDKWMGLFHDYDFYNYKTILTFDENGKILSERKPFDEGMQIAVIVCQLPI